MTAVWFQKFDTPLILLSLLSRASLIHFVSGIVMQMATGVLPSSLLPLSGCDTTQPPVSCLEHTSCRWIFLGSRVIGAVWGLHQRGWHSRASGVHAEQLSQAEDAVPSPNQVYSAYCSSFSRQIADPCP